MEEGDFTVSEAVFSSGAPEELQDLSVEGLTITPDTAVLHYVRGAEPGTATFTFGNRY